MAAIIRLPEPKSKTQDANETLALVCEIMAGRLLAGDPTQDEWALYQIAILTGAFSDRWRGRPASHPIIPHPLCLPQAGRGTI
jgi:hypothetical protein